MLELTLPQMDFWDEINSTFITLESVTLALEHSLLSVSKWESKYEKPFLAPGEKTTEETYAYIEAMLLSGPPPQLFIVRLTEDLLKQIHSYIESKQSATTFHGQEVNGKRVETITSELIYFWMVSFNIPFECQTWHLNRLISLIRVCNVKQSKPKKMSRAEMARQRHELNARRRAEMNSKG